MPIADDVMTRPAAIITGGGAGLGRALGELIGHRDLHVVVADIDGDAARATAGSIRATGGHAEAQTLDVTEPGALPALIDEVAAQRPVAYVFNNAGIGGTLPVDDATPEQWSRIIALNIRSVVDGTTAAYRVMRAQGHGHIVNTASIAGLLPIPLQALYNTTKYAVVGLSTSLRIEAEPYGVRVSAVCPGNIATDIFGKPLLGPAAHGVQAPDDAITPRDAAERIMRGVDQNRELIVFPRNARLLILLHRYAPVLWRRWASAERRRRVPTPAAAGNIAARSRR